MHVLYAKSNMLIFIFAILTAINASAGDYIFDTEGNIRFGWMLKDEVGTYTLAGSRIFGQVDYVSDNKLYALLNLKGWSTKANTSYYAYAPYDTRYVTEGCPITALPISYLGQQQSRNNDVSHLTACDYMMAKYTTGSSTADIQLSHIGSVVRLEWLLDKGEIFKSLTLTADEPLFVAEATMNLPDGSVNVTSKMTDYSINLDGVTTQDGASLVVYFMLYPLAIPDTTIKATLLTADDRQYEATINGGQLRAGMSYPVIIGASKSSGGETIQDVDTSTPPASTLSTPSVIAADFPFDSENPLNGNILTDIQEVENNNIAERPDGGIYTLTGIRVTRPNSNGLYIYNGKKFIYHTNK